MSVPIGTVSRALTPLILIYGFYLVITGVVSPGGAFGGGVVVGVVACLSVASEEGIKGFPFDLRSLRRTRSLGLGAILLICAAGFVLGGGFLEMGIVIGKGMFSNPFLVILGFGVGSVVGSEMVIALGEMLREEDSQ